MIYGHELASEMAVEEGTSSSCLEYVPFSIEHTTGMSRGDFIASGVSGIIERLPSGHISKSPWNGQHEMYSREDLRIEARIYDAIGTHDRLVRFLGWDPEECRLTMEYMSQGSLDDFLKNRKDHITEPLRIRWIVQAAEALCVLHSFSVIHCDFTPRNLLLSEDLQLKVIDFAGSSYLGSTPTVSATAAFFPTAQLMDECSVQFDLFALGSVIFTIVTGRTPFEENSDDEIQERYELGQFASVEGLRYGEIIGKCWHGRFKTAEEVATALSQYNRP